MQRYERGAFSVQMVYKRTRGWTLGQSFPTKNVLDHPSSSRLGRECLKFNEHCYVVTPYN